MAAARPGAAKDDAQPGQILLVIHDFVARSADELSLAKGDRIELIERDDDFGDGWFLGRHMANGNSGLFPEVYTTPAPRGTLAAAHQRRISDGRIPTNTQSAHLPSSGLQQAQRPGSSSSGGIPQASASPIAQTALRSSMASTSSAARNTAFSADSPVMNETLSVINEHITDLSTPRSSVHDDDRATKRSSIYSANLNRYSYIPGHETDEDEGEMHTEAEVMAWTPDQVAEYLEDRGVERMHCDVFREQEISGEVLLAMDQSSLFIKEFQLGPVGRRLKTWHKIKALHDEVRRSNTEVAPTASDYSGPVDDHAAERSRNRSSTVGAPAPPRGLETRNSVGEGAVSQSRTNGQIRSSGGFSPLQNMAATMRPDANVRPSAQSIRTMNSRRHSSIDSTPELGAVRSGHRKQPSIDQTWQPSKIAESSSLLAQPSPSDLDKGYFSSNEVDSRSQSRSRTKHVLTKTGSSSNSPAASKSDLFGRDKPGQTPREVQASSWSAGRQHSFNSAVTAMTDRFSNFRSATGPAKTMRNMQEDLNPVVTKLEHTNSIGSMTASPATLTSDTSSAAVTPSPSTGSFGLFSNYRSKLGGLRAISDAITEKEKATLVSEKIPAGIKEDVNSPTRTGSTTPSTETRSFDLQKSDVHSRTSAGSGPTLVPPPPSKRRIRTRGKKNTSAYTRGLEKKTPAEAMADCDYSGWMKKKSGSLMTTWKSRLFVLKGRRLSYYYSDGDTEEKGLIDISFHRVLPASNETITGLHAALTGAASPTSPKDTATLTMSARDLQDQPKIPEGAEDLFIFKLVPPKVGLSKAVNFTKPTVHYFAVQSRAEGRLWMAALMKATIDRDSESVVTTTYNQKTISLQKARARKERPPALKDEGDAGLATGATTPTDGLGIDGLTAASGGDGAVAGAEKGPVVEDGSSSIMASTLAPSEAQDNEASSTYEDAPTVNATA